MIHNVEDSLSRDLANLRFFHLVPPITRVIYNVKNILIKDLANLSLFYLVSPITNVIYNMENSLRSDPQHGEQPQQGPG